MPRFAVKRLENDPRDSSLRIVARDIGALQILVGASMVVSAAVSLAYGEGYSAASLLAAAAATMAAGALAYRRCRDAGDPKRRHAMVIAGAGWLVSAAFGSLPFLLAAYLTPWREAAALVPPGETYGSSLAYFRNPLHALFESMSAWTTTGLTMAVHEPSIGHGLLFYRSLAQWLGGAGVIVLSLAIIPRPRGVGWLDLYQTETTGMKLRPTILGTARAIWRIYATLTLGVALYLFVATILILPGYGLGASLFDAVNHAMTGQSTGGFSTLDDSIAGYRSRAMELVHIPPMILGATSIPLFFAFLRSRDIRVFWRDPQSRSMLLLFALGGPLLASLLVGTAAVSDPLGESIFQVVSSVSTTGWQTSNIGDWNSSAVLLLAWGAMITGGAAGATVGGIKLIRAYLLFHAIRWRIRGTFLPGEAVLPFRLGDKSLPSDTMSREVADAAVLTFLYLLVLAVSTIIVACQVGPEFTLADVIFECVSAQSTVGLSTGITVPGMSWVVEVVFIFQMWVGRLEIFPVLVFLSALLSLRRI